MLTSVTKLVPYERSISDTWRSLLDNVHIVMLHLTTQPVLIISQPVISIYRLRNLSAAYQLSETYFIPTKQFK